jgi:hypothetical protein
MVISIGNIDSIQNGHKKAQKEGSFFTVGPWNGGTLE